MKCLNYKLGHVVIKLNFITAVHVSHAKCENKETLQVYMYFE